MPGKLLCLDIDSDSVSVVQVQSGLKAYRVLACAHAVIEEGLERTLGQILQGMDLENDICRVAVSADRASYRNLRLPFKDEKKIRQVLPFEVEAVVPFSIDEVVTDFLAIHRAQEGEILAVSLRKDYIRELLQNLGEHGVEPNLLEVRCAPLASWLLKRQDTPEDGLLLDLGHRRGTMVLFSGGRINLIRSFRLEHDPSFLESPAILESRLEPFCKQLGNTIHAFAWSNNLTPRPQKIFLSGTGAVPGTEEMISRFLALPVEQVNVRQDKRVLMDREIAEAWKPLVMDHALALALRGGGKGAGLDFLKDEFETRGRFSGLRTGIRRVSAAMIIVLCFLIADLAVDYYLMKKRYDMLDRRITLVYRETFPGAGRIVDPLKQMKIKLKEVQGSSGLLPSTDSEPRVIDILKDISVRIPKSLDVHLTTMVISPEKVR
ncbi:MAG: pilus assembly protein PilM, partial [Deltaproteobacteria bacterium]|nr:pilus assembly protein PilM [Deltaproteobacteria bacterium]